MQQEHRSTIALPGLNVISITATPQRGEKDGDEGVSEDATDAIELGEDDRVALGPRWNGKKEAVLVEPESPRDVDCVAALATATLAHLEGGAQTVACIANTVRVPGRCSRR